VFSNRPSQEDHLLDAQLLRGAALLFLAQSGQAARSQIGVVAALVAAGQQHVGDLFASLGPLDDRPGTPKLWVVRVRGNNHHAIEGF
jgi:hypothetical protein